MPDALQRLRRALTYDGIGWWFTPMWAWRWYNAGGYPALRAAWLWATKEQRRG